jgi:hypothetical protein
MATQDRQRFGWLAAAGSIAAIAACYGTLAVVGGLSLLGISADIHEGVWAGVIVAFAMLAFVGLVFGHRCHRRIGPLFTGGIGALLVLGVMLVTYSRMVEIIGFTALIAAAIWDWREKKRVVDPVTAVADVDVKDPT